MPYHFHTTHVFFLPAIADRGLVPTEHAHHDKPAVFFEPDYQGAAIYLEPKARMLRWPAGPFEDTEDGECVRVIPVPPGEVEIEVTPRQGDWMPLTKAMEGMARPDGKIYAPAYVEKAIEKILEHLAGLKP